MQSQIKDVPIKLPDGVNVKLGMKVFTVESKRKRQSYQEITNNDQYKTGTGDRSAYMVEHEVISVNQASNARCFTLRSDKGCEHTYSVRNQCIGHLYGKKTSAEKQMKLVDKGDIGEINKKINSIKNSIEKQKNTIKKWETVKKKLNQSK